MYDDDYEYLGLPPKPYWFKNLEKAWKTNKKAGAERRIKKSNDYFAPFGSPMDILKNPDPYRNWCKEHGKRKRPVGRPKLPPEELKRPKVKRSDQMRQLLKDNGIEVLDDLTLSGHSNIKFMVNGRVGGKGLTISVHQFLQNIDAK